ncbi:molecular chaperone TorD family protein [Paucidesulfovibrio longus]|uniref:molecular chaperone TorD family protein n=1 Tax=Paucidesulfovibrio longus TaxID=889 RepID=UPI0003B42AFC|nr:molecular chaperone TorD family protein [Paucidesulfovibrio longus]
MDKIILNRKAAVLRDFFASVDAGDLREAAEGIAAQFDLPLDAATDWTEVEYDFNRLFVGPAAVPAPPYASAYQAGREQPALMGEPALEARRAYERLGLAVPNQGTTPDDHLAFELDAVVALDGLDPAGAGNESAQVKAWLIAEHMGAWVPRFAEAVEGQRGVSAPVAVAVKALTVWLEAARSEIEAERTGQSLHNDGT